MGKASNGLEVVHGGFGYGLKKLDEKRECLSLLIVLNSKLLLHPLKRCGKIDKV